jgi:putative endopeptidase
MNLHPRLLAAATLLLGAALLPSSSTAQQPPAPAASGEAHTYTPIPGFDRSAMDASADPCDDFYKFACGNFSRLHPIPPDLPEFDQFANLYEYNTQALHGILEKAQASHPASGTNEQKIADYYGSCMDTSAIDKAGLAPIQPELDRIAALKDRNQLPALIAHDVKIGSGAFLVFSSQQDFKDATREIAVIDQGGLGLPEKDYYLRNGDRDKELRQEYVQHLANMLRLLGDDPGKASAEAKSIMELETALAKVSQGNVERRNPDAIYHMTPVAAFATATPNLAVPEFLKDTGAPPVTELNVASPEFFKGLNQVLASTDMETIRNYLRVHLADSFSMRLPHTFDQESFDFYGRKLEGTPQQQPRWKRCVNATDAALGEALGRVYVEQYFAGDSKQKTLQEVHDIESAMGSDLDQLTWMSPETKAKAQQKDRLPQHVARLLRARDQAQRRPGRLNPIPRIRNRLPAQQNWQAREQGRVADESAYRQRLLRPQHEHHQFPCRHPPARLL